MYEIIPDLWICENKLLKNINMNNIINFNCEKDLNFIDRYKNYEYNIRKEILKNDLLKMYNYILLNIEKMNTHLMNNEVIIVSCDTCKILSPLLIICFLIKYAKLNIEESILCFESKTNIIVDDEVFFNTLIKKIYSDSKKII